MSHVVENATTSPALSGVRVIELSQFNAGASCAEFLAWLGADVVKIESPAGASERYAKTEKPGVDSYDFILLNANKRSVMCDLQTERGKADLRKLIANADVVVENMALGVADSLGFGHDAVQEINPRIVCAQITGFASGNPRSNYVCGDVVAQAVGGSIATTGYKDGPPLVPGLTLGETGAALHAVMGIVAALHQRESTGRGQRIGISMQEAVINLSRIHYVPPIQKRKPYKRVGNNSRHAAAPSDVYPCKPGGPNDYVLINISRSANHHWQGLLKAMGREDLINNPELTTSQGRADNRERIDALVLEWTNKVTKFEAMDTVQKAGATAGAVLDMRDLIEDPDLRKRGIFATVDHPVRGAVTMPGWPVKMAESQVPLKCAPALGAHTAEVLKEWLAPRQSETKTSTPGANQALSGVKVVDFTQFEAGPSCTEVLAWLGADVVKIEEPVKGDRGRSNTEIPGVDAPYFILLNANKRSFACDLKAQAGKDMVRKLIAKADIVIENMAPGVIERLGFGYDAVRKINPTVVYAQIKGFASDGPRADYRCFDTIAVATGGATAVTGTDDNKPLRPGAHLGDTGTGLHCVTGVLAALYQRKKTGRGQRVQAAMSEAVINFNRLNFATYLASGKVPGRDGSIGLYPCQGGGQDDYCYVAIAHLDDQQWRRLLRAVAKAELSEDVRFNSAAKRAQNRAAIDGIVAPWCLERTKIEAMDVLQAAGVPAGAVFGTQELHDDPYLRESGMFVEIDHPKRGRIGMPGWAVRMSDSPTQVRSAPLLGQHTEEVLSEWLGLGKQEIQEFRNVATAADSRADIPA